LSPTTPIQLSTLLPLQSTSFLFTYLFFICCKWDKHKPYPSHHLSFNYHHPAHSLTVMPVQPLPLPTTDKKLSDPDKLIAFHPKDEFSSANTFNPNLQFDTFDQCSHMLNHTQRRCISRSPLIQVHTKMVLPWEAIFTAAQSHASKNTHYNRVLVQYSDYNNSYWNTVRA
jgi:hypothetical protein